MTDADQNPIGYIQEMCQKHSYRFPQYEDVGCTGPDHCREFKVKCKFEGFEALGQARQRKLAKSEAAQAMISVLKSNGFFDKQDFEKKISNGDNYYETGSKNPISVINEFCQKSSWLQPDFVETSTSPGEFLCQCTVNNKKTYGQGPNKKSAKTEAALKMCKEFKLKTASVVDSLQELEVEKNLDSLTGKNPVSALQELYIKKSNKKPEYTELPQEKNIFVYKCIVDEVSSEGRGTTKKIAKFEAAKNVLAKLLPQTENFEQTNGKVLAISSPVAATVVSVQGNGELEDFNLDTDEDEENEEGIEKKDKDVSKDIHVDLNVKLEAMSLKPDDELKDASDIKLKDSTEAPEGPGQSSTLS